MRSSPVVRKSRLNNDLVGSLKGTDVQIVKGSCHRYRIGLTSKFTRVLLL